MTVRYEHLVGRSFLWGVRDCYALVRDFFADNFDMALANYGRPTDWESDKLDLMRACYGREGFEMITTWTLKDLRPGDVLCMAIGESTGNHFAVFVGDNTLCHHIYGRLSTAEPLRDFWRNSVCYLLRHPDVPDLRPVLEDVDIGSLLSARYNLQPDA